MKFSYFDPNGALVEDAGPSKTELLHAIEQDYWAEQTCGENDPAVLAALDAKYAAVKAAKTDTAAQDAYS